MRLNAPRGQEVKFTASGGYPDQRVNAEKVLDTETTYIVDDVDVGSSHSYVYLHGFDDPFNTVMFEEVGELLEPTETIEDRYLRQYGKPVI